MTGPHFVMGVLLGVFFLPWLLLGYHAGLPTLPNWPELWPILLHSGVQASFSTIGALVLGMMGALGLCAIEKPRRLAFVELLCLVPVWLPPLFVVLSILNIFTRIGGFPYGMIGVVLVHVVMTMGLVAVSLSRTIRQRLGRQVELAWLEGASRWKLFRQGFIPQLQSEFLWLGLVIFGFSFTSFSVPLLVGGGQANSLEIYIYQQLRSGGGFSAVLGLGLVEWAVLMLLAQPFMLLRAQPRQELTRLKMVALQPALVLPMATTGLVLLGGGWSWQAGYQQFQKFPELQTALPTAVTYSALVAIGTGVTFALLVGLIAIVSPHRGLRWLMLSNSAPTTVIVGTSLLLFGTFSGGEAIFKLVLGFVILFLPSIYRLLGLSAVEALQEQIHVARLCGASHWRIGTRIVLPQISRELSWIAALGSLWAVGDFALSRIVLPQDLTLAMIIQGLMSSYRLDLASWLMLPLVGIGVFVAAAFLGAGHVAYRKFAS